MAKELTQKGASTRGQLLQAAQAEMAASGGGIEVGAVSSRAGVSPGLLYRYFGSRDGLVAAVVENFYDRYDAEVMLAAPEPGAGWAARERARTRRLVDFYYGHPLAAVVLAGFGANAQAAEVESQRIQRHIQLAERNLRMAQQRGELLADIELRFAGAMIIGGFRQAVGEALRLSPRPEARELADQLWDFMLTALQYRPPRRRHS